MEKGRLGTLKAGAEMRRCDTEVPCTLLPICATRAPAATSARIGAFEGAFSATLAAAAAAGAAATAADDDEEAAATGAVTARDLRRLAGAGRGMPVELVAGAEAGGAGRICSISCCRMLL